MTKIYRIIRLLFCYEYTDIVYVYTGLAVGEEKREGQ